MLDFAKDVIDFDQRSLAIAAAAIAFNPIYWNTLARQEYHHQILSRHLNHSRHAACYFLAISIFTLGLFRDYLFHAALSHQPTFSLPHLPFLPAQTLPLLALLLIATGNILVLTSTYALGITGTYLGDYCGILMEEPVRSFPFSILDAPMYQGSTLTFVGVALWYASPAGLLLAAEVWGVYWLALRWEDPFTRGIYERRERERAREGEEAKKVL